MKVLIVNTFDRDGGAARSARRLHWALREAGVDSRMQVLHQTGDDPHTRESRSLTHRLLRNRLALIDALPLGLYPKRSLTHWANAWFPGSIENAVREWDPDIIHLHWINRGLVSIPDLRRWGKPVVWTLHDHWPFTGGCHYPELGCESYRQQCGTCPLLHSGKEQDLSRWIWNRKCKHWKEVDLHVIGPSRWLTGRAASSSLFRDVPCQALPNAIDTELYSPGDRAEARKRLGLPLEKPLVLMVAMNPHFDRNKGGHLALEAVQLAADTLGPDAAELCVAGEPEREDAPESPWKVHRLGVISEETEMVDLYRAVDVQLVPSYQENLSNALMEAASCGLPCIAFDAGGNPDLVQHGETGILATPYEPASLAGALTRLISESDLRTRMGTAAREHILQFSEQSEIARRHIQLYEGLV